MTDLQELMLCVCFGTAMGTLLGNLIVIISCAVSTAGEKRRKRKNTTESAAAE